MRQTQWAKQDVCYTDWATTNCKRCEKGINPLRPKSGQRQTSPVKLWAGIGSATWEKLAGNLLLGQKFNKLEILSTSFIAFLWQLSWENIKSRSLGLKGATYERWLSTEGGGLYTEVIHMECQGGVYTRVYSNSQPCVFWIKFLFPCMQ